MAPAHQRSVKDSNTMACVPVMADSVSEERETVSVCVVWEGSPSMTGFLEDPETLLGGLSLSAAVMGDSALSECRINRDTLDLTVNCGLCLGEEWDASSWSHSLGAEP